jgi:hypothetical protein
LTRVDALRGFGVRWIETVTFDTIGQVSLENEAWTNASFDVDGNYVLLLILHRGKPRGSIVKLSRRD